MRQRRALPALAILLACAAAARADRPDRPGGASRRSWWSFPRLAQVGVLEVDGVIDDARPLVSALRKFEHNPLIKALVLRIDSPGGEVGPVQEVAAELRKFRDGGRPVVASFGGVAASGGYYLACCADRIVSNPGALTGSIGVIMEFPDAEGLLKKLGVRFTVVKSGRYKDTGSFARGLTDEERAVLQDTINDVYQQFLDSVWEGRRSPVRLACARKRRLPPARVSDREAKAFLAEIADGRVLSGRQARDAGLVDELGGMDDAVEAAWRLAGYSGRPSVAAAPRRREASWTDLLGTVFLGTPPSAALPTRNRISLGYLLR